MEKHFDLTITDNSFSYSRKQNEIDREALLDGIYVVRTPVSKEEMNDNDVVLSYKRLARVERAFRTLKTSQLEIRPIYHWNAERVKGHALLCMLAYYVEWHLRKKLAPLLFDETDPEAAEVLRENPVVKAKRSPSAKAKESRKRTPDDLPVLSFKGLLKHLAAYTWIQAASRSAKRHSFVMYAQPSPLQEKAFELLGIKPNKM
ncbi:hypothetical protein LJC22_05390 [Desulfosarcina sp. OttesenSCG-928-G10]|nr:hypothetical protein [Desulfosarcina sp. OttesenSCG-928-G10]